MPGRSSCRFCGRTLTSLALSESRTPTRPPFADSMTTPVSPLSSGADAKSRSFTCAPTRYSSASIPASASAPIGGML
eukprot:1756865-Prymnesium_polylepis.1